MSRLPSKSYIVSGFAGADRERCLLAASPGGSALKLAAG
jgi:hypothetical protein